MFRSLMKFVFWIFLLLSGIFTAISGFVIFPADLWFVQFIWAFMGGCMLFASCIVASTLISK